MQKDAYRRISQKPREKELEQLRNMENLAITLRPYWKQIGELKNHFFMRYCNRKNLNDKQIEQLRKAEFEKEYFNAGLWQAKLDSQSGLSVAVKYLKSQNIEQDCMVFTTNRVWSCLHPGCTESTCLILSGPSQAWYVPYCSAHVAEFRETIKAKSLCKW